MWMQALVDSDKLERIRHLDPGSYGADVPMNPPHFGGPGEVPDFLESHDHGNDNIDEPDADFMVRNSSMSGQPPSSDRSWPET